MLEIVIPSQEYYDEETEYFFEVPGAILLLEHSLVSLSKWESFYEKPFLTEEPRTTEETLYYIECMLLEPIEDVSILKSLSKENAEKINSYINRRNTATWFNEAPGAKKTKQSEIVTSEIIYYWMVTLNIPFSCETWNLSRLLTLIRVINAKNQPKQKMNKQDAAARARELNRMRQQQHNTSG